MEDALRVAAVLGLTAANAFFVIGEYAVVTARRSAVAARADASASARTALRLMDDPVRVISTVQVGITALGILTGAIGEPIVRDLLGDGLPQWAGFIVAFGIVTYLSVVLGELVPKALTLQRAESLVVLTAPPIQAMSVALRPIVWVLQGSASRLLGLFGIGNVVVGDTVRSPEELRALVDQAEVAGVIPRAQEELLHNVFEFADREARDVMVPAADVAWLDADLTADAALERALDLPYARYPVGDGSIDRVIGIVHLRDLAAGSRQAPAPRVRALARGTLVVPETKDLGALLREFREQHHTLAIIGDEYGGTVGVVSVEDILEQIVGEIEDEFDLPDSSVTWVDDRRLQVAGSISVDDFNELTALALPQDGPHTLAGLVFEVLGRRPTPDDEVSIDGTSLRVNTVDGLRIALLDVTLPEPPDDSHGR